jgi:hypothetical protein
MNQFLERHDITVLSRKPEGGRWAYRWEVACPFCGEADKAAAITLSREGRYGYKCWHNRCSGVNHKRWRDFKSHYEPGTDGTGLPEIVINGRQLRDITLDALDALALANEPPEYFVRAEVPVRLREFEAGGLYFEVCRKEVMRMMLADAADWYTVKPGKDDEPVKQTAAIPPVPVVENVLAQPAWPGLPPIISVTQTPVFVAGGRLVSEPGYDPEAKLWMDANGLDLGDVPEKPTAEEVTEARALLEELVYDFPWGDGAAKANALALLLLPYVRPLIDGPTPLHLINAPAAGTGKDLLAQLAPILAMGRHCATKSESHGEEEWKKNLTAWLTEAPPFIYIENVNYALSSATFAKCLTGRSHRDRLLGRNDKEHDLPITCVWLATGNNVMMSQELARRVVQIRIDANLERPEQRDGFKHRLPDWAFANRRDLVRACLVLVRAWVAAGMPKRQPPQQVGSFEAWAETMSGILTTVGITGFLENWGDGLNDLNSSEGEWAEFVHAWYGQFAEGWKTTKELYETLCMEYEYGRGSLRTGLLGSIFSRDSKAGGDHQLGLALSRKKNTVIGSYKIEHRAQNKSNDHKTRWRLQAVQPVPPTEPEPAPLEKRLPEVRGVAEGCGGFVHPTPPAANPVPDAVRGVAEGCGGFAIVRTSDFFGRRKTCNS